MSPIKKLLLDPLESGEEPVFQSQRELAEEITKNSYFSLASAESGLSRIFNEDRFSLALRDAIRSAFISKVSERQFASSKESLVSRLEIAFNNVEAIRRNEKVQGPQNAVVAEMYREYAEAKSSLIAYPFLALQGSDPLRVRKRRSIAERLALGDDNPDPTFRTICFSSEAFMYEWLVSTIWASTDVYGLAPTEAYLKAKERQARGILTLKVLQETACMVPVLFLNTRPNIEHPLSGFIYHWEGDIRVNVQKIEGYYLTLWQKYLQAISANDACFVQTEVDTDIERYEKSVLAHRLTL